MSLCIPKALNYEINNNFLKKLRKILVIKRLENGRKKNKEELYAQVSFLNRIKENDL